MPTDLTRHARQRCKQRALPYELVDALLAYADIERAGRDGVACLRLSRRSADELLADGASREAIDKLRRSECLIGPDGRVVTVIRVRSDTAFGRRGRRCSNRRAH